MSVLRLLQRLLRVGPYSDEAILSDPANASVVPSIEAPFIPPQAGERQHPHEEGEPR